MILLGGIGQGSSRNIAGDVKEINPFSLANVDDINGGTGTGRIGGGAPVDRENSSPYPSGKSKKSIHF